MSTLSAPTLDSDEAAAIRARGLCPTCYANGVLTIMQPAGKHSFLCPRQRDQGNGVSAAMRAACREMSQAIEPVCGF